VPPSHVLFFCNKTVVATVHDLQLTALFRSCDALPKVVATSLPAQPTERRGVKMFVLT